MVSRKKARVLVVEDSPTQAGVLRKILESAGFEVATAANGKDGLEHFRASKFDLVLSDILMPGMSGYEFCWNVKSTAREVPVVLLTTLNDVTDIVQGLECGADNFIMKPFDPAYLVGRIRNILANTKDLGARFEKNSIAFSFAGKSFFITSDTRQVLAYLVSTFEDFLRVKDREHASKLEKEKQRLELESFRARFELLVREHDVVREIVEHAPVGIVRMDEDLVITELNQVFCKQWGLPADLIVGHDIVEALPILPVGPMIECLRRGKSYQIEDYKIVLPHMPERGDTFWDLMTWPIKSKTDEQMRGAVLLAVEVTGRIRLNFGEREP